MIERKQLGELTAMARSARQMAADGIAEQERAERLEGEIDRLALANGFTVDQVYAPLFAEQNNQPEPAAA